LLDANNIVELCISRASCTTDIEQRPMTAQRLESEFRSSTTADEHFAVAVFPDGGVLLDLQTGAFYRLNETAAQISELLICGTPSAELVREVARRFRVPDATAEQDVEAVRAQLRHSAPTLVGANPITFRSDSTGFVLCWNGLTVLHIEPNQQLLTRLPGSAQAAPDLTTQLRWAVPHLLLMQHQFVLHAAAVQDGTAVLAFCGPSGLGKTTLAQHLAAQGMRLVAEDLVVVSLTPQGVPEVVLNGEPAIRAWVSDQCAVLAARGQIRTEGLVLAAQGPRAPLGKILFPYRAESSEPRIHIEQLSRAEALVLLLENSFAELGQRGLWLEILEASRRLVISSCIQRARIPQGLQPLNEATKRFCDALMP
jgi:hypothetical protein